MRPTDRSLSLRGNSPPVPLAPEPPALVTLAFDDNKHASLLFGLYDQNLAKVERRLGVVANALGNQVTIKGPPEACEQAREVLETLYGRVKLGQSVGPGDVDGAIEERALQGSLFPNADIPRTHFEQISTRRRGIVRARNAAQDLYIRCLKRQSSVSPKGRPEPARPGSRSAMPSRCSSRASSSG